MSTSDDRVSKARMQQEVGKITRENVNRMRERGYVNYEIAACLGIAESTVRSLIDPKPTEIQETETIWFPGIYGGRTDAEYTQKVSELLLELEVLIERVQKRANEDGEWAIANGFVGNNEDKMRRMMAFVADEQNIRQCIEHIRKEGSETERTVDWVCRELANASKWVIK